MRGLLDREEMAMMAIAQTAAAQAKLLMPISVGIGFLGTAGACAFSRHVVQSLGAGAGIALGFPTYFCTAAVVDKHGTEKMKPYSREIAAGASLLAVSFVCALCHTPFELVLLASIVSVVALRKLIIL